MVIGASCSTTQASDDSSNDPPVVTQAGLLEWVDCENLFECSTINVPLDYDDPDGEQIAISLIRRPAQDQEQRLGSIIVNFGGPGGSGVEILRAAISNFRPLSERFDIVSFDPRGVGSSQPVDCLSDSELDEFFAMDADPETEAEFERMVEVYENFAQSCADKVGPLIFHVTTAEVAQDLDLIREALGDEKLSYLGYSYGTSIGASYLEQFPERARALVLDGAVHPSLSFLDQLVEQTKGFEQAFDAFVLDCNLDDECPLAPDARAAVEALAARVEVAPIDAAGPRDLGPGLLEYGIVAALYSEESWDFLADSLNSAIAGEPSSLIFLADLYADRNSDGTYSGNLIEGLFAVDCSDNPAPTFEEVVAAASEFEGEIPLGAANIWSVIPCITWPRLSTPTIGPLQISMNVPALVVGTTGDPATPVAWAREMAAQIPGAGLLIFEGEGHTAYPGSTCVDNLVEGFFIDPGSLHSAEC